MNPNVTVSGFAWDSFAQELTITNQNHNTMKTQKGKTVFIEYSTAEKGQHFMTVINYADGKRKIVGRIFSEYDKEKKQMNYTATDWAGNQIFADTEKLYDLKNKFIERGKALAQFTPQQEPTQEEEEMAKHFPESEERGDEVKEIRERKAERTKEQGIER